MADQIGSPITGLTNFNINTKMPSLVDSADIQEAFRLYHYGAKSGTGAGEYDPTNTQASNLIQPSIAYSLYSLQTQITNVSGSLGVNASAWTAKGTLISASGPSSVSALPIGTAGQVLTVNTPISGTTTGLVWSSPEVTLANAVTLSGKTLTAPKMSSTFIADSNGNELIIFPAAVTSAVNEITITNAATTATPSISATGTDTNISLNIIPKGTGVLQVGGDTVATLGNTITLTNKTLSNPTITNDLYLGLNSRVVFEGSIDDAFETILTVTNPTVDRTITLPDIDGTVVTTGNLTSITGTGTVTTGTWNSSIALPTASSTTDGRMSWDSTNKKIQVGDGTSATDFASSTLKYNFAALTSNNYTLVLTDKDKMIELNNGGIAGTLTVPTASSVAFPVGSQIDIIQTGIGQFTITPATITTATYSSGGAATATSFVISASNASIAVGQLVTGTGFDTNTYVTSVSGTTISVSPPIKTQISGTITFSVGVMGTPGLKLRSTWSSATLVKRATAAGVDAWFVVGDLSL